jgi:hypothetical protein
VTINKANQATLTITAPTSATYGDADATTSPPTVDRAPAQCRFDAGTSPACSIVSGNAPRGIGHRHLLDSRRPKAGDANFNPTTSIAFTVSINRLLPIARSLGIR